MQFSKLFLRMKDILTKKAIAAIIISLFWTDNSFAVSVKHHFDSTVGIFNAGGADFTYEVDTAKYAVHSHLYTMGMFDTLYRFIAGYATSGRIEKNQMKTEHYSYEAQSRFSKWSKKVLYSTEGLPLKSISTKNGKMREKLIKTRDDIGGTTDLQSVFAAMARQYLQTGSCKSVRKVFDSKRRYNVIFDDLGVDWLEKDERSPYFGRALKCSMSIDRLQEEGDDLLWKLTSESPVYFWIMRDKESNLPFIARVKVGKTPLGEMNVYTTEIEVSK